ncbi:MAG: metal-sensing transcriptional repressor [Bacillales bacterium]|nr:metal-sensing transcriptional repressor [Bacillales bacterium]MDD6808054.1 metal-sensing transcriptional repressor [Oscillospiraceae bacterium]
MKADKQKVLKLLHTVQGQLNGIEKMINNDDYCMNISNQLLASIAILKKINIEIVSAHLQSCVVNATSEEDKKEKIDEIAYLLQRMN